MVLDPETEHAPAAEGIQRVIDQVHAIHHLHGDVAPDLGDVCAGKSRGPDFCSGPNAEKHKHTFNMFNIPLCQGFIHFGKKTSSNHRCALPLLLPFFSLCQSPGHSPSSMKWTSKALWTPRHCAQGPNHDAPAGCHEAGARGDAHESGHRADGGAHTAGFASTNAGKPPGGRAGWRMLHRAVGLVLKNLWKVCTTWHDPFLLRIRTSIPKKLE